MIQIKTQTLSVEDEENLTRWRIWKRSFFEVYFVKINDLSRNIALWLRYTLLSSESGKREAMVWGAFFDFKNRANNVAIRNGYPINGVHIGKRNFDISVGPSEFAGSKLKGQVQNDRSKMTWALQFEKGGILVRHLPWPLYYGPFPSSKFVAPFCSARISGEIVINSEKIQLDSAPAYEGHFWGTEQYPWVWAHCNTFQEDDTCFFEGVSARPKILGHGLPQLTALFFYWEGCLHRVSSPIKWFRNRSSYRLGYFAFEAEEKGLRFSGTLTAKPADMIVWCFENPDGTKLFSHLSFNADMSLQIFRKEKKNWKVVKSLTAVKSATLDITLPKPDPRVAKYWI